MRAYTALHSVPNAPGELADQGIIRFTKKPKLQRFEKHLKQLLTRQAYGTTRVILQLAIRMEYGQQK